MSTSFCKYLSHQRYFSYGQMKPCCWFSKSVDLSESDEVEQYQQWLYSITNWVPECGFCYAQEQNNNISPRLKARQYISDKHEFGKIVKVEIQIDRDCNGACLICGPHNSTAWAKYTPKFKSIGLDVYLDNELDVKKYLRQIKETIDYNSVLNITFSGGEPFRSDTHLEIVNEITNIRPLSEIILSYQTNGSIMPTDRIISIWQKCRHVNLTLGIDAIEEHFNYLRYPLQWNQVENNLNKILELKIPHLHIDNSYVVTPFSIFYHDRYVQWATNFFLNTQVDKQNFFSSPRAANGPMNISAVPIQLQKIIHTKYQNIIIPSRDSIISCLHPHDPTTYRTFMDYIIEQDQKRGTDWRTVFPEIVPYFSLDNSV